jgi:hypothetical protein
MKNTPITQQHNSKQQGAGGIYEILCLLPVWVCLPVRINLWLQPNNTLLNSVTEPVDLYITPQELRTIEINITQQHLTIEAALIAYLKQEMKHNEKWQVLIEQIHQVYGKDATAVIDIELLGKITWNGSFLNVS